MKAGHPIALFFSLHNTETGEYLEGPPENGGGGKFKSLAERFFRILSTETTFAPTQPLRFAEITTTAGMTGRMNVVQGLYRDFKIAAFLMEQRISNNPKLGHLPEIADRMAFGGAVGRGDRQSRSGAYFKLTGINFSTITTSRQTPSSLPCFS